MSISVQDNSKEETTSLVWENKDEKNPKQKTLTASSSIGVYSISWNTQDHVLTYDLFFQEEFILSDTVIKELYAEAETHYKGKVLYLEYIKK